MAWRYLKGNKGCESPRHIFSVDTETLREPHPTRQGYHIERLRLGVVRYCRLDRGKPSCRHIMAFNASEQFWAFIERNAQPRANNWIFAHGMGFDLRSLGWQQRIDSDELRLYSYGRKRGSEATGRPEVEKRHGLLVLDGIPTIIDCWVASGRRLRMVDTRNWWHCSLAEMGNELGLPKLPMPDPWDTDEQWLTYCQRDCEILEEAVIGLFRWQREHDLGVFKPSAAGQAMQAFRHRFMSHKPCIHDEVEVKKLERAAYYAGRLDIFFRGRIEATDRGVKGMLFDKFTENARTPCGTVYKLDVNSLFPYVMRSNHFPKILKTWNLTQSGSQNQLPDNMGSMVATVLLNNCCESYPVRQAGKVIFASGSFRTTLAGPELQQAAKSGSIAAVESWAEYDLDDLFSSYVDYFYQLRFMAKLAGRNLEAGLCKLMLNSLYGKFAQRSFEWKTLPDAMPPEPWHNWHAIDREANAIREYRSIGETVQLRQDLGDHPNSFAAISAFVTSYARLHMDRLRSIAGYHNVYYQGVDSLFVSELGLERLQAAGEVAEGVMGKLRLEGESRDTQFLARGVYHFNGKWVAVSIRTGAKQVADLEYTQDQFESLAQSCYHQPIDGVCVKPINRKLATDPGALELTDHGWVRPKRFNAWPLSPEQTDATSCCDQSVLGRSCSVGSGIH